MYSRMEVENRSWEKGGCSVIRGVEGGGRENKRKKCSGKESDGKRVEEDSRMEVWRRIIRNRKDE